MNLSEDVFSVSPSAKADMPARVTSQKAAVSFEFFPPRQVGALSGFCDTVMDLSRLAPKFVSVTYGAGGSTRDLTRGLVCEIQKYCNVPAAAHLTCIGGTRAEINAIAHDYWRAGIHQLIALRGDPPGGINACYQPISEGYAYADDLVAGLLRLHPFDIKVAAYPETHPQAKSAEADLDHLKRKVDAGATGAITQFFFDTDYFERFVDRAVRGGITVPIVPGILPMRNFAKVSSMAAACGAHIPMRLRKRFADLVDDAKGLRELAFETVLAQCEALRRFGVNHFHFYTLNRADLIQDICAELGVQPSYKDSADN